MAREYIVVGPHVWGRGKTANEAMKKAQKEYGSRKLKNWSVFDVPGGCEVDGMGCFVYEQNQEPPRMLLALKDGDYYGPTDDLPEKKG